MLSVIVVLFVGLFGVNSSYSTINIRMAPGSLHEHIPTVTHTFRSLNTISSINSITAHASSLQTNEVYIVAHVICYDGRELWCGAIGNCLKQSCENCVVKLRDEIC